MPALHRISRLRQPRSNRASTALLIITFGVFAVLGQLAIEQKRGNGLWAEESHPAPANAEQLDARSRVHRLRF